MPSPGAAQVRVTPSDTGTKLATVIIPLIATTSPGCAAASCARSCASVDATTFVETQPVWARAEAAAVIGASDEVVLSPHAAAPSMEATASRFLLRNMGAFL